MFAPNGDLYGFDVGYGGGSGAWGRINPATGAFTQIGNLNTSFHRWSMTTMKTMGSHSHLVHQGIYMRQDTMRIERQLRLRDIEPDNGGLHQNRCLSGRIRRFVGRMGQHHLLRRHQQRRSLTFGTVDSAGNTTTIATGLSFGGAGAEKLMFAPNGDLYGFDVGYGGGSGAWGRINPATGAFTQIGNLNTSFPRWSMTTMKTMGSHSRLVHQGIYMRQDTMRIGRQLRLRDIEPDNRGLHQNRCLSGRIRRFVGRARPRTFNVRLARRRRRNPTGYRLAVPISGFVYQKRRSQVAL